MKNKNYEEFIEKFEQKKTTDDCYTPDAVYNVVSDWVCTEYSLNSKNFVRPFYPGEDFEHFSYPENCIVVDNPPFSIFSKIINFYTENNIKFFLFAPSRTFFEARDKNCCYIGVGINVEFENGANIDISFATNLEHAGVRTAPTLYHSIKGIQGKKERSKYIYPPEILNFSLLNKMSQYGVNVKINMEQLYFIRGLDSQRKYKTHIYGAGFLMSEEATKECIKAEQQIMQQKLMRKQNKHKWELSEREKEIIKRLGKT